MALPNIGMTRSTPSTYVEIFISCRNLADMDFFSKSDPMVVAFMRDPMTNVYSEIGRTEIIWNNLNPDFVKKIELEYRFEERQHLKFSVYDIDCDSPDLSKHDFIGSMECTLGEIVANQRLKRELLHSESDRNQSMADRGQHIKAGRKNRGSIISVVAEEKSDCKENLVLDVRAEKLHSQGWLWGKADPFLAIYRLEPDGSKLLVHRTEVARRTLNPKWKRFSLSLGQLCRGNREGPIEIKCMHWNRNGNEKELGSIRTSPGGLINASHGGSPLTLKRPSGSGPGGSLMVCGATIEHVFTFLDFIDRGTELNCLVAIDFTASNGNPSDPRSLHHWNPDQPNQYVRALRAVGEVIQDYDDDNIFPTYGFGALVPPGWQPSHLFHVNFMQDPGCQGIDGVLMAYQNCITQVRLYGPTNFAPCINEAARQASQGTNGSQYYILLIITDGIITDMPQTMDAIISAAVLPLSIIIVGVGDDDFEAMHVLDGDEVRLSHNGRVASRDIVQFVAFNEFIAKNQRSLSVSQVLLARAVLEEIPGQITSYMKSRGIQPGAWPGAREHRTRRTSSISSTSSGPRVPQAQPAPGPGAPMAAGAPPPSMAPHVPSVPPQAGGQTGQTTFPAGNEPPPPYSVASVQAPYPPQGGGFAAQGAAAYPPQGGGYAPQERGGAYPPYPMQQGAPSDNQFGVKGASAYPGGQAPYPTY